MSAFSEALTFYRELFDHNPPIPLIVTLNAKPDILLKAPASSPEGEAQPEQQRMRLQLNGLEFKSIDEALIEKCS